MRHRDHRLPACLPAQQQQRVGNTSNEADLGRGVARGTSLAAGKGARSEPKVADLNPLRLKHTAIGTAPNETESRANEG